MNEAWKALEHWRHSSHQPRQRRTRKTALSSPEGASS
jgi:hypothetical protein